MSKPKCLNCTLFYYDSTAYRCCSEPKRNPPRVKRLTPEETAKRAYWEALLEKASAEA